MSALKKFGRLYMLSSRFDYNHFLNIHLETAAHCNRRCHYCPQSKLPYGVEFMPDELVGLSLRKIKSYNWSGPIIFCVFNEPLLDKRLPNILKLARELNPTCDLQIFSNGDLLNESLADELVDSGLTSCIITPHPPYKDGWSGRVGKVCDKYPKIFQCINGITPYRVGGLNNLPSNRKETCDYPAWSFVIRYDGSIPICCIDYKKDNTYGNIKDSEIREVWYNSKFVEDRKKLREGIAPNEICRLCMEG